MNAEQRASMHAALAKNNAMLAEQIVAIRTLAKPIEGDERSAKVLCEEEKFALAGVIKNHAAMDRAIRAHFKFANEEISESEKFRASVFVAMVARDDAEDIARFLGDHYRPFAQKFQRVARDWGAPDPLVLPAAWRGRS